MTAPKPKHTPIKCPHCHWAPSVIKCESCETQFELRPIPDPPAFVESAKRLAEAAKKHKMMGQGCGGLGLELENALAAFEKAAKDTEINQEDRP